MEGAVFYLSHNCHFMQLGVAVSELAQQRGKRDLLLTGECFVGIISRVTA